MQISFRTYIIAIKYRYEIARKGMYASYLDRPTTASIKNLCSLLFKTSSNNKDKAILAAFFKIKEDDDSIMAIEKFDNDKLRPIVNFFNGKTESPNHAITDLMALLVDFEPRPLSKYLKNGGFEIEETKQNALIEENLVIDTRENNFEQKKSRSKSKLFLSVGLFILVGIFVFNYATKEKYNCMFWNEDHYEGISCDALSESNTFVNTTSFFPIDEHAIKHFKKITPTDTTTFFKNGKPCIWYGKSSNGTYEYFTAPGLHPETGRALKDISKYIINKHIIEK